MSAVRMCDKCGKIFSEREDGWSTFSGTRIARDPVTGAQRNVTENIDTCPECTIGPALTPRLALDSMTGVDRLARTMTQEDRDRALGITPHDLG